jgi:hypothetical protein
MKRTAKYRGDASDDQVRWGSNADPRGILQSGKEYSIKRIVVHSQHTKVFLEDFPDMPFNSVHFEIIG